MPRKPRHQERGEHYHVVTRGNNKLPIFDEELRAAFLRNLVRVSVANEWRVLAYAVMNNHYHFVLRLGEAGLSTGMFQLNNAFARASNARFDRINHCFGQRFWSAHLDTTDYLLASISYSMWNPPRAGLCSDPAGSTWSSFRGSVGLDDPHPVLALNDLYALFDPRPENARLVLYDYVQDGRVRCLAPWAGPPSS
jgi:REP element-mobilizing transposase RayT